LGGVFIPLDDADVLMAPVQYQRSSQLYAQLERGCWRTASTVHSAPTADQDLFSKFPVSSSRYRHEAGGTSFIYVISYSTLFIYSISDTTLFPTRHYLSVYYYICIFIVMNSHTPIFLHTSDIYVLIHHSLFYSRSYCNLHVIEPSYRFHTTS
jgi:hypothetical protein